MALKRSEVRRLRVVDLEEVRHQHEGQEWVPHWHDEWSIGAIVAGHCRCSVGGQPLWATAGDLVAVAPGAVHTGALLSTKGMDGVLVVMFYVPLTWFSMRQIEPPTRSGKLRQPKLVSQAEGLSTVEASTDWLCLATSALRRALRGPQHGGPERTPSVAERAVLQQVRAAVLEGEHSVSGLANRCGVSRERVHRVMTQLLGLSPREYLMAVRLHRAKQLVMAGEPIASVAADCGFADQPHFTRWFRRAFGYTPGELAAAMDLPTFGP